MNSKLSFFVCLFILSFTGCDVKDKQCMEVSISGSVSDDAYTNNINDTIAFCPALYNEIESFIAERTSEFTTVVELWIENKEDKCLIYLSDAEYYWTDFLCGYQVIKGKMIAYCYNPIDREENASHILNRLKKERKDAVLAESECSSNLIDKSKLHRDFPTHFPNEEHAGNGFEGYGREFIVHSPDSLELIYEGLSRKWFLNLGCRILTE